MRAELEELEELEDDELEDDLEDELLLELDELDEDELEDELLLELDEELEDVLDALDDEEDGELDDELDDPSGPVGVPSVQACSSIPRPATATLPDRIRRNCRRSSRRSFSSGTEGLLNMLQTSASTQSNRRAGGGVPAHNGGSAPPS